MDVFTLAPLRASSNAKPRPIPLEAPVTMATLPCSDSDPDFDMVEMIFLTVRDLRGLIQNKICPCYYEVIW